MNRNIEMTSVYGKELEFIELTGQEGISELYEFTLTLTSKNPNLDPHQIIGQTSSVHINSKNNTIRHLNGLVTDFGYLHEDPDEHEYHLYTCILRPNMWYLSQRYDSRVFVNKSIIDITNIILGEFGFDYQINCQNNYRKYGHSIQYQETSFNYLSRLFEQEGIYYYFEHKKDSHTLIITDDKSQHPKILGTATLPYHSKHVDPGTPNQAYIEEWRQSAHLTTSKVNVNDHNYNTAKRKLTASSPTHELNSTPTEHYDFYTNFKDSGEANHYKQIRSEDYIAQSKRVHASGNVLTIAPGYTFTLNRHPHQVANTEHLVISASYHLVEAGYTTSSRHTLYHIDFTAIPSECQYRAPRKTDKPKIVGSQAAIITGPAGEEVYTNDYGDIKLQFHWDRYGPSNQESSDWIRVIQGSAGVGFGSINTPRIGEEVLVDFINGDSDRPIVVGRLYNSDNPPPWGFPTAAKQSGIKSKSFNSPIENYNELMFDDTASQELVNFQAQKDLTSLVKNDETRTVNHDRTTTIDNDETVTVHGFRTETVDKDETITIHQNRTETVDMDETITIHQNRTETVDMDETITIGVNRTESVGGNEKIDVTGNRTRTVTGNESVSVTGKQDVSITQDKSETVAQNRKIAVSQNQSNEVTLDHTHSVGKNFIQSIGANFQLNVTDNKVDGIGKNYELTVADQLVISVGASGLVMNKNGSIKLFGKSLEIDGTGNIDLTAPDVNIN